MGLDISVYQNIKKVITEDYEEFDFAAFVIDDRWLYKIKNLEKNAKYVGDIAEPEVGYSYSSHYQFRNYLCEIILEREVKRFSDEELDEKMPFIELIDFADNEGCLDWEVSEKLYKDFVEYKDKAVKYLEEQNEPHFRDRYLDWLKVFEVAKERGVVVFR